MTEAARLDVYVGFTDKATAGLKKVSGQFDKSSKGITGKVTSLGKSVIGLAAKFTMLAGVAGIAAVGLAAKSAISTFTDFEAAIANAASVTGATGEVFEATKKHISDVSKELGATTVFSASQAANAFYDLASAGYDVANMTKDELKPILDLAAATQNDLTKTTEVVTSTLGQFGIGMESSGRVADVFAKTIGSSKATIGALENSLKYIGPIANSMGMEIEEVNAILGNLYNAGFKGEQAGTVLRGAFAKLLNPTTAMVDKLVDMGLTLADVDPTTRDFADILDTLSDAGMDTNDAMALFGVEAAPGVLALVENTDGIRDLEAALLDVGGTAETMAEQQLDTLSGSFALLKSSLEGAAITIGEALAPYIKKLAEWITAMIPKVMEFAGKVKESLTPAFNAFVTFIKDNFPKVKKWIKGIIDKLIDILPKIKELAAHFVEKLQPAFKSVEKIGKSLGKIFGSLTSEVGDNDAAFVALTDIADVVASVLNVVADVVAAVIGWFAEHPTITKFAAIAIGAVLLMNPVFLILTSTIGLIMAALALLAVAWDNDWLGIKTTTLEIVDAISAAIELFIAAATTAIQVFLALLKGDWEGAWDAIKTYITEWGPQIVATVKNIGKAVIEALVNGIKAALGALWDIITGEESVTSTIVNGIKSIIPKSESGGKEISEGVADGIKGGVPAVSAATTDVTSSITTELKTASPDAKQTGLSTSLAMAEGIASGTSAVSAAAKSIVDAASAEMNRLVVLAQEAVRRANERAEFDEVVAAQAPPEGALDIAGQVISHISPTSGGRASVNLLETGAIGTGQELTSKWNGDIKTMAGQYYITESVWNRLSTEEQAALADNIIAVLADDWQESVKVGREEGSNLYKRFIKESAFWTPEERQLAALISASEELTAEMNHLQDLGVSLDDTDYAAELLMLQEEIDRLLQQGITIPDAPSADTGGFVAQDTGLNVHQGEWVIPTKGGPVLTGGKDTTLNMTYNIGTVVGVSDFERILEKHDRDLFKKLQSLV